MACISLDLDLDLSWVATSGVWSKWNGGSMPGETFGTPDTPPSFLRSIRAPPPLTKVWMVTERDEAPHDMGRVLNTSMTDHASAIPWSNVGRMTPVMPSCKSKSSNHR